ncbi:Serine/threonine-protein kinase 17A [Taenia crassiceps]|uniref:Serine/threonine-protein kinase 17A n=1 Tax=Taenia crassiceps TaxID=6207 RepID=A0ABR4QKW4_9CEST
MCFSGGAGKVFRVKLKCGSYFHERKSSVPACLPAGEFGPGLELINEIPDGKSLAVKIIRRFRCGRDSIEKIHNEIELIKALQPLNKDYNVPSAVAPLLFSVHEGPSQVAIVMEFAEGGSLFDLRSPKSFNRPPLLSGDGDFGDVIVPQSRIPESYVSSVLLRIVDALAFMHGKANVVHLDIKAENILLRKPYPSPDVFITDFGLASVLNKSKPHKELAGTPDYMAPEVISYDPVSFATDMWSVGVLTYFLLTGVSPFLAENKALTLSNITQMKIDYPSHLFEAVSPLALDFIRSLIKRNPKARLSASQFLTEDGGAGASGDESTSSTSSSSSTSSPTRKRLALDNTVTGSQGNVETLNALAVVPGCCKALTSRALFSLEGLPRHHSPVSASSPYRHHHHHQPRRRSVLASISPPSTVAEVSPVD